MVYDIMTVCATNRKVATQAVFNGKLTSQNLFVVGNWKMNGDKESINQLIGCLSKLGGKQDVDIVVAPPTIYLDYVKSQIPKGINVAAQNCFKADNGAYTGETSPVMLKDVGIEWVIIGHLERRYLFGETNELIADKVVHATQHGLKVIFCVGEQVHERQEDGQARLAVQRQLQALADRDVDWRKIVIAYEALSDHGKAASAEYVQSMHEWVRHVLEQGHTTTIKKQNGYPAEYPHRSVRVIYGGCVTGENCFEFANQPDIDGFLVGGAFLRPEFAKIVNARTPAVQGA